MCRKQSNYGKTENEYGYKPAKGADFEFDWDNESGFSQINGANIKVIPRHYSLNI